MRLYIVDAFAAKRFGGNQAGVVILEENEPYPEDRFLCGLAAELRHSETVFLKKLAQNHYQLRYFTPTGEVDLCGHATVAAFTVLREEAGEKPGQFIAETRAGTLNITLEQATVWMDMAPPQELRGFNSQEQQALYQAFGLGLEACPDGLQPYAVSTGLCDILLPVRDMSALQGAVQNECLVTQLSCRYDVVGVHMFWAGLDQEAVAHCRNFAPRYGIPEESATGTSSGALTYYLYRRGFLQAGVVNRLIQGEKMGRPSELLTTLADHAGEITIRVGGPAVLCLRCSLL